MFRKLIAITLLACCMAGQACSKERKAQTSTPTPASKPKHELYLEWHDQCLSGKTKDIDTQIKRYEDRIHIDDNDELARVYLGSACAQRAKASFWGPTKLKFLKRGQQLMDKAVDSAPSDPRVRMVRAIGSYKVPKRFNRRKVAIADFEKLVPIAAKTSSGLKTNERQAILYYAWLTYKEAGRKDAQKTKKLCHQIAPSSKYGKLTAP